jgi:hypothetical protein
MGLLYFKPRLMIHDFPKEIQDKVPPLNRAEKAQETIFGGVVLALFVGVLVYFSSQLRVANGGSIAFMTAFVNIYLLCLFFNVFDLLVLDYLMIVVWKPKFTIVPGFENVAYLYQNFAYHFKGFLKGLLITAVVSLVIAFIASR